jgi:hypothetical protein
MQIGEMRALPLGVAGRTKWPLLTVFFFLPLSLQGSEILYAVLIHTKIRLREKLYWLMNETASLRQPDSVGQLIYSASFR